MDPTVPFPDSYWVIPGKFLAGEYPGAREEQAARRKLRALIRAGVDLCIDLTEPGELPPYTDWLRAEAEEYMRSVEHMRFPIPDFTAPSPKLVREVLDTIDAAIADGRVVYLHCWGGIGRTGTIVGCYLVRHGRTGRDAVADIAELRSATPNRIYPSPESPDQLDLILDWPVGE